MQRTIIEYKILCHEFSREIAEEANKLIKEGWQPYEGLTSKGSRFYQVMVRYERYA